MMEADLIAHLLADAGVSALVGTRIYPSLASQNAAAPYVVLRRVSTVGKRGTGGPAGLDRARIQIESYADTYGEAKSLAVAIRTALDGTAITNIRLSQFETEHDDFDEAAELHRTISEFFTWA